MVDYDDDGRLLKLDFKQIQREVPYGSILGPLLYIIFVNELPSCPGIVLYAHETSHVFSRASLEMLETHIF